MKEKNKINLTNNFKKVKELEYGTKELIHGLLMGIIIGFIFAMYLLK